MPMPLKALPNKLLCGRTLVTKALHPRMQSCTAYKEAKGGRANRGTKEANRKISAFRVRVEHAIGSVKRYRIVKDECRLRKNRYPQNVFPICTGLHNFRLKFMPFNYPEIKSI
jgi:hypothetical protein